MMEMMRERSSSSTTTTTTGIPNFSTIPCFNFKWGRQKQLICVKHPSPENDSPSRLTRSESSDPVFRKRRSPSCDATDGNGSDKDTKCGIKFAREKLALDLRNELRNAGKHSPAADAAVGEVRPWNLRTRRAVCKDPNNTPATNNSNGGVSDGKHRVSPVKGMKSTVESDQVEEKRPRAKFAVSLSKQEIEEDFLAISGCRPARRPKKRAKQFQRQVDAVFPGLWLSEITADMYKVNEQLPDGGKR